MRNISAQEIKRVKEIAKNNFYESSEIGDEGMTNFVFNGMRIINPWISECGRFELTDKEAIETYGLENVMNFIITILEEGR